MKSIRIKNSGALLRKLPRESAYIRGILLKISEYVLREIQPVKLISASFVKQKTRGFSRVHVIAIGKASRTMTDAVKKILGKKVGNILFADTGHPFPTRAGVNNAKRIAKFAGTLTSKDCAIVLISGGGSAMLTLPSEGLSLADTIKTTRCLLKSGATIQETNAVRKHISQINGGRLATLLCPARVLGIIISDVVGNDVSVVASGPLSPDQTTFKDAMAVIKKYRLTPKIPSRVLRHLKSVAEESPKNGAACFKKVTLKIIADHKTVLQKALEKTKELGFTPIVLTEKLRGEARDIGAYLMHNATNWRTYHNAVSSGRKRKLIYLAAGETTVTVRGRGRGGRNQELVLGGLTKIRNGGAILSIGTDGVDGICPELIAGAIGDSINAAAADINRHLAQNDSYGYFKKHGGLIKTGPTGTNIGDLVIIHP